MLFITDLARSDHFSGEAANIMVKVTLIVDINNQIPETTLGNWSGVVAQWSDSQAVSEEQLFVECSWDRLA